jgi:predicted chitinase
MASRLRERNFMITGGTSDVGRALTIQLATLGADIGIVVACEYWKDRQINRLADKDDVEAVTRAINGGMNGYPDRVTLTKKAKEIWGYVEKVG